MPKRPSIRNLAWGMLIVLISGTLSSCWLGTTHDLGTEPPAASTATLVDAESMGAVAATAPPETAPAKTSRRKSEAAVDHAAVDHDVRAPAGGAKTFAIDQKQSEARFLINEILLGRDNTVIGITSQVNGKVTVNPTNPSSAIISTIRVDARDLTTDNRRRNQSLQRFVLRTVLDENQFVVFEPTAIEGLPESVDIGRPFEFLVKGMLTVRDVTRPETFYMTVIASSGDQLSGLGTTSVLYSDYGIIIPGVSAVTSVEDEVRLEIKFVAIAD